VTALASSGLFAAVALVCAASAVVILLLGRRSGAAAWLASAAAAAGLWLAAVAAFPDRPLDGIAGAAETLRSLVWFALLLALYRRAGGARIFGPVLRFGLAGAALALLGLAAMIPGVTDAIVLPSLGSPALLARLGLAIVTVLLAENLYRNADEAARWHVNLPCIAVATLAILDILLYADAVLARSFSPAMLDARAVLTGLAMPLFAIAAGRSRRLRRPLQLSREVAFHSATLIVAGTFLLGIGIAGEVLRQLGADWGRAAQISLGAALVMALAVVGASQSARSRLRRLVIDHFFAARYDYRREWLRCVATLSSGETEADAPVRAIRAIADPADSPGGVLLLRDPLEREAAGAKVPIRYRWGGSWNMREAADLALPPDHPLIQALRGGTWVATFAPESGAPAAPEDLEAAFGRLWLAVPLWHHREGLVGAVLLSRPRAPFPLDVETYDLLRTLGREVAMFLAERRAAERLVDQRQLQDYAKRFAFVAHDVKTVSSQLSLLLANAEENIADPEFQRDMLLTVRAAADRINALIARLRQPEPESSVEAAGRSGGTGHAGAVRLEPLARLAAIARQRRHPVELDLPDRPIGEVAISPASLDAAVTHLLDNAIEASAPGVPVTVAARREADTIVIDITDRGPGMTAEFVRDRLFRPLSTSKPQGSGIGAWQARELLREAGGDLSVLTRPGAGTTMRLVLPIVRDTPPGPLEEPGRAEARRHA
jgi:putative PEP-CTERM system histidine kinase